MSQETPSRTAEEAPPVETGNGKPPEPEAWHALDGDEVLARLEVDDQEGLTPDDAAKRLDRHGPNRLPEEERESALRRFLKQSHSLLIYILLSLEAVVVRDGKRATIPAEELVPGDVVRLESGDRVPADIRILTARNARVEEAPLTGESEPVGKDPEPVDEGALVGAGAA